MGGGGGAEDREIRAGSSTVEVGLSDEGCKGSFAADMKNTCHIAKLACAPSLELARPVEQES
jgi:hypothetical protein